MNINVKKLGALALATGILFAPTVPALANAGAIVLSQETLPLLAPYETDRAYEFTATFVGDSSIVGDYVTFSSEDIEALFASLNSLEGAVTSSDGNWIFQNTAVSTTFEFHPEANLDKLVDSAFDPLNAVISTMNVSGITRNFPASNGSVTIPLTIFHTHIASGGRAYQGNINRTAQGFTVSAQGVLIGGWGTYAGTIRHYGMNAWELPVDSFDTVYHETFGAIYLD